MAIPTGGSKRKGSPVEKPEANREILQRHEKKVRDRQFMSFPLKQKYDNAAVKGAMKKAKGTVKKVLGTISRVKLP